MAEKRINFDEDRNDRLVKVCRKLKIKHRKTISQEETILRYVDEGLKKDEKKLEIIKLI